MKNPHLQNTPEAPEAEKPSLEEILNKAGTLASRLISLINKCHDGAIHPEMILPGNLSDGIRAQKITWNAGCFNPVEVAINRRGDQENEITELFIVFYPGEQGKFDIFSEIKEGLEREWVIKNQPVPASSHLKVKTYLQTNAFRKMEIANVKLVYNRTNCGNYGQNNPFSIQISMFMADDSIITFDPLITYKDIKEERGVFSRIVYARILDQLAKSIEQGEAVLISTMMSEAFRKVKLFGSDKEEDKDSKSGSLNLKTNGTKITN